MPLLIHYMMMLRRDIPLPAGWGGAPPPLWKSGGSVMSVMRVSVRVLCCVCVFVQLVHGGERPAQMRMRFFQAHLAMKGRKYSRSWAEKILIMKMNWSTDPSRFFATSVAICSMA